MKIIYRNCENQEVFWLHTHIHSVHLPRIKNDYLKMRYKAKTRIMVRGRSEMKKKIIKLRVGVVNWKAGEKFVFFSFHLYGFFSVPFSGETFLYDPFNRPRIVQLTKRHRVTKKKTFPQFQCVGMSNNVKYAAESINKISNWHKLYHVKFKGMPFRRGCPML